MNIFYQVFRIFFKGDNRNHSIQYFDNYSDAEIRFYSVIASDLADKTIDYNAAYLIDSYGNTIEYKVFDRRVEKKPEPEPETEQQTESEN